MSEVKNPIPSFLEATDAAAKVIRLQRDLFLLDQELKTIRQIRRTLWLGLSVILMHLFLTFVFYWLGMALHEIGWSSISLAGISGLFFGVLILLAVLASIRSANAHKNH